MGTDAFLVDRTGHYHGPWSLLITIVVVEPSTVPVWNIQLLLNKQMNEYMEASIFQVWLSSFLYFGAIFL